MRRIVLHKGEKGCEVCGADLVRRVTWTRFCHPCMAERTRAAIRKSLKKRKQKLKENRLCLWCGDPAAEGNQHCDFHREKTNEFSKRHYLKRTAGTGRYTNCGVCGCLIRKNGFVKYCRPCSVDRNGAWHKRRKVKRLKEKGLCTACGKIPPVKDRVLCKECSAMKNAVHRQIYNERKREGRCTECGKVPKGKTLRCEECRLDKKRKEFRREMRKEG